MHIHEKIENTLTPIRMCGRYTLSKEEIECDTKFGVLRSKNIGKRFNVAPSQKMPVIRLQDGRAVLSLMTWGWKPSWATSPLINAQGETITEKPTFKKVFAMGQRCLIPADGFYEWGKGKQPFHMVAGDGDPLFFFAGLWQAFHHELGPEKVDCFLILTTKANSVLAPIHHRMPVMFRPGEELSVWLSDDLEAAKGLTGNQLEGLRAYPVGRQVNSARHDGPDCIVEV